MPWQKVEPMNEKARFLGDFLNGYFDFFELCYHYGISRKTGYKWVSRYQEIGSPRALEDRSRRPHHSPSKTAEKIETALLKVREHHPSWGPRKLLDVVYRKHPKWELPAVSTVALILQRAGKIKPRRRRLRRYHPGRPLRESAAPNGLWTAEFKGHVKTLNGVYCYPLTVADNFSRYLLACDGLKSTSLVPTIKVFGRLFEELGLPDRIRTDNGVPFASNALGRLSRLSVWWVRLGIVPELIEPGCPEQNGRHERMHRTLKYETTIPAKKDLATQQRRFDDFRGEFNGERPHEALQMKIPGEVYRPSKKRVPSKLPLIEYPCHFEVRLVSDNGGIRWNHYWVCVSHVLAREYIGLEEVDTGLWDVYFGPLWLGRLEEKLMKIRDQRGRVLRKIERSRV